MNHFVTIGDDAMYHLVRGVADHGVYMLDPDGVVLNWKAGAELTKGYFAEEIVGQNFERFYTEEDRRAGVPQRALDQARTEGRYAGEG